jgi:phenylpropionate dioxygenase-like ring-hydroxylating dioxygenase large terminal subunit
MAQERDYMEESPVEGRPRPRFLRDAWYVGGFTEELEATPLLSRKLLADPVLFFRDAGGQAVAIGNRCPHRFAPLSRGRLIAGEVRCGYHGLGFDGTGRCVHNPHGSTGSLSVPAYPVIERAGLLWIWMGDPQRANSALIPAFQRLDETEFHLRRGYLYGQANYELMSDNILDLSHIEYLHPALGTEAVSRAKVEVSQDGGVLKTTRRIRNETLPPGLAQIYRSGTKSVNRTMSVTWQPAANLVLEVSVEPVDPVENWRTSSSTLHLFTPETDTSTHYFYVGSLPKATADSATADAFQAALRRAFTTEDKPMIDAQAQMIGTADIMDLRPALLPIDKAAVLARRALAKLIGA